MRGLSGKLVADRARLADDEVDAVELPPQPLEPQAPDIAKGDDGDQAPWRSWQRELAGEQVDRLPTVGDDAGRTPAVEVRQEVRIGQRVVKATSQPPGDDDESGAVLQRPLHRELRVGLVLGFRQI